ncbi:MAG: hypothetical protein R3266_00700 [Gemmatimonadota bacterium]|nr:hypothetical protein [Gemmatimonadota bacterium]
MLSNGLRVVEATAQDAGRWLVNHPVEAGAGALALILIGKFLRR